MTWGKDDDAYWAEVAKEIRLEKKGLLPRCHCGQPTTSSTPWCPAHQDRHNARRPNPEVTARLKDMTEEELGRYCDDLIRRCEDPPPSLVRQILTPAPVPLGESEGSGPAPMDP